MNPVNLFTSMNNALKREMSITHEEFLRIFNSAFARYIINQGPDFINMEIAGAKVKIYLNPEMNKKIASLEWVVTEVELDLSGLPQQVATRFLSRFERAAQ